MNVTRGPGPCRSGKTTVIAEGAPRHCVRAARVAGDWRCLSEQSVVGDCHKTGWMMSEQAGFANPQWIQGFLDRNRRNAQ